MTLNFEYKTVLITGGSSGIGRSITEAFLASNANVICMQRTSSNLTHPNLTTINCDLSDRSDVEEKLLLMDSQGVNIDILVNNAGTNFNEDLRKINLNKWDKLLQVNTTSPLQLAEHCSKHMVNKKWGRIINITSISIYDNTPFNMLYGASKSALSSFTMSWAKQLAKFGITVNSIAPGFTKTAFTKGISDDATSNNCDPIESYENIFKTEIPTKSATQPSDIADACLFLCSESGKNITGETVKIDGGQFMSI